MNVYNAVFHRELNIDRISKIEAFITVAMKTETATKVSVLIFGMYCKFYGCANFLYHQIHSNRRRKVQIKIFTFLVFDHINLIKFGLSYRFHKFSPKVFF